MKWDWNNLEIPSLLKDKSLPLTSINSRKRINVGRFNEFANGEMNAANWPCNIWNILDLASHSTTKTLINLFQLGAITCSVPCCFVKQPNHELCSSCEKFSLFTCTISKVLCYFNEREIRRRFSFYSLDSAS